MATISNKVTLDEIVNTIKLRSGITDHYRIMSVVLSMLQEFNLFYIKEKKTIEINPNGRNFIELPQDFVEYMKIGYILPSGEIRTLTKNERLADSLSMICGDDYSWLEKQDVDVCVDPEKVEAKDIVYLSTFNESYLFYPASLTDTTIYNNSDELFNRSSYYITSIDYLEKIITINKPLDLPLFDSSYPNMWQIHAKPTNPNTDSNIVQLSEVLDSNKFRYSGSIDENTFIVSRPISFRNPYMFYIPMNNFDIITSDISGVNGFYPYFITKISGTYHALVMTLKSGVWYKTHHITSTDFKVWDKCTESNSINNIYTIGSGWWSISQPAGLNGNLFLGNSNVETNTHFVLPVSLFVGNPYTHQRIGIAYLKKDFSEITISANPITFDGFNNNDSSYTLGETSMIKYKDKTYLALERAKLPNEITVGREIFIFEYDIDNNETKLITRLTPNRVGNEKWNDNLIQQPSLFISNDKLFLYCRGYGGNTINYVNPNAPNCGGLYYFNGIKFEEYFNNPMVINPKKNTDASKLYDHTGYNIFYNDGETVYSFISLTHGTNLYNILPSRLNIRGYREVSNWIKNNK